MPTILVNVRISVREYVCHSKSKHNDAQKNARIQLLEVPKLLSILLPVVCNLCKFVQLEYLCVLKYHQSKCDAWKVILHHSEVIKRTLPA